MLITETEGPGNLQNVCCFIKNKNIVMCHIRQEPEGLASHVQTVLGESFKVLKEIDFFNRHQRVVLKNFVVASEQTKERVYLYYIR
ncbi:hypothetical protein Enr10x_01010 [Gimesia panareensis]|uniref:Uncharacterized protein n=1 Tax=Gimesia panareensis TaxID=2527978 RepID=A0A517PZK1_9PLAN|nr:hypothetical protein Enr10x_01010 [Gimesia panareensis]